MSMGEPAPLLEFNDMAMSNVASENSISVVFLAELVQVSLEDTVG